MINTTSNSDTALFNNASGGTVVVDGNRNVNTVNFDTNAGSYTLSGGPLLISGGGSISLLSSMTSTGQTETISAAVGLEGNYSNDNIQNNAASATDALVVSGNITDASTQNPVGLVLQGSNSGSNTISGVISDGWKGLSLTKSGAGNWILAGANTFVGGASLNQGTLQLNNSNALTTNVVSINTTNGLTFGSGIGSFSIAGLNGSSNEALSDVSSSPVTLVIGAYVNTQYGNTYTYSGTLSGAGGVTSLMFGPNTTSFVQVFSKNNSYTGATTVDQGNLKTTETTATGTTPFGVGAVVLNGGVLTFAPSDSGNAAMYRHASHVLGRGLHQPGTRWRYKSHSDGGQCG